MFYPSDIEQVITHKDYNAQTRSNDIGMIIFYHTIPHRNMSTDFSLVYPTLYKMPKFSENIRPMPIALDAPPKYKACIQIYSLLLKIILDLMSSLFGQMDTKKTQLIIGYLDA